MATSTPLAPKPPPLASGPSTRIASMRFKTSPIAPGGNQNLGSALRASRRLKSWAVHAADGFEKRGWLHKKLPGKSKFISCWFELDEPTEVLSTSIRSQPLPLSSFIAPILPLPPSLPCLSPLLANALHPCLLVESSPFLHDIHI